MRFAIAIPQFYADGEFDPTMPLTPSVVEAALEGLQIPPGNAPSPYEADRPSELGKVIEAIDEVSRGKLQP